jgi:cysteine desulfurase
MHSLPLVTERPSLGLKEGPPDTIYMDYHATTPVDPRVLEWVMMCMREVFGNPSSAHHEHGSRADTLVDSARRNVAVLAGAEPSDVVFTSGATEAANLAIRGLAATYAAAGKKLRVVATAVEHKAVLETCSTLHVQGVVDLVVIPVDRVGRPDPEALLKACQKGADLVCVIHASNEVGTISDVAGIAAAVHAYGCLLLVDATQSFGKVGVRFTDWDLDVLVCSAHKMYGPKGAGALIIRPGLRIEPLITGGSQERGLRAGTLNTAAVAGFGLACDLRAREMAVDEPRVAAQRDKLQTLLASSLPDIRINGDQHYRLAGNLHVSLDVPSNAVVARLRRILAVSTGSACTGGIEGPSHVVQALGLSQREQDGTLRVGIGKFTTDEEVIAAADLIVATTQQLRAQLRAG